MTLTDVRSVNLLVAIIAVILIVGIYLLHEDLAREAHSIAQLRNIEAKNGQGTLRSVYVQPGQTIHGNVVVRSIVTNDQPEHWDCSGFSRMVGTPTVGGAQVDVAAGMGMAVRNPMLQGDPGCGYLVTYSVQ